MLHLTHRFLQALRGPVGTCRSAVCRFGILVALAGLVLLVFSCEVTDPSGTASPGPDPTTTASAAPTGTPAPLGPTLAPVFVRPDTTSVLAPLAAADTAPAGAHEYFVDGNTGLDTNNGTTAATAWKTLDRLHRQALEPGDVVRLARGSVFENQHLLLDGNWSGTESAPIIIQAYGSGKIPTIRAPRALWDKAREFMGIQVTGTSSWIRILGLKVEETASVAGINLGIDTSHITIADCEVQRCNVGINIAGEHQTVVANLVHDIGAAGGSGGIGIQLVGKDLDIGWNRIFNCQAYSDVGDLGVDGGAFEFYGYVGGMVGYDYLSENIRIHHNLIDGCLNFMELYGNIDGMNISWNVYLNGPNEALEFHYDDCEHPVWTHTCNYDNLVIEHNTFVPNPDDRKSGWGIIGLLVDLDDLVHYPDPAINRTTLRNNIFVTNYRVVAFKNVLGANLVHDHNLYCMLDGARPSNDTTNFVLGPTDILLDATHPGSAGFMDAAGWNWRLSADSPARDAGTAAALYSTDFLGTAVPQGTAPDIGAYED